jgi:hypothetical protein
MSSLRIFCFEHANNFKRGLRIRIIILIGKTKSERNNQVFTIYVSRSGFCSRVAYVTDVYETGSEAGYEYCFDIGIPVGFASYTVICSFVKMVPGRRSDTNH